MRAVNLIPEDLQGGTPGRTGGSVYVLLGALAVLVVLVAVVSVFDREVAERKGEVARAQSEARAAEAKAATLQGYQRVAQLRQERSTAVTELSRRRFNWSYAMREISNALPKDVWLVSLVGAAAAAPAQGVATAAPSTPKIDINGCTIDQDDVARYLATLRSVDGVTRVGLAQTTREAADEGSAGAGEKECPERAKARFTAAVFFENAAIPAAGGAPSGQGAAAPAGQAAAAPAPGSAPAGGTAQPATSTTTTPAQPAEQPGGAR